MKPLLPALCSFALLIPALLSTSHAQLALNREPGAVYLEGITESPIQIPVPKPAAIYYGIDLKRYLGTLKVGQQLELQAIADHAYRVRGKAQQGQVVGWIPIAAIAPLKPEFLQAMKEAGQRRAQVEELIANKEVAMGMTSDEVQLSLGRPQKKSTRVDADGRQEVWEYISYRTVPQQQSYIDRFNRLAYRTVYVKVPDGQVSVIMLDHIVNAIEESEGNLVDARNVRIVVPPIEISY